MAEQIILPRPVLDGNGDPISGAKFTFFLEGTTTAEVVYSDQALTSAHPSPLETNAEGVLPVVWHAGDHGVKVVATNASDVELSWSPLDPAPMTSSATSAENISYTPSANNPASNVQDAIDNASALGRNVENRSSDYTAVLADRATVIRATASLTLSTSAANVLTEGWFVELLADGGDLTVAPSGGSTIGVIKDGSGGTLFCDGTSFYLRRNTFSRGTAGSLAYGDSNGDQTLLAVGSSGQFLSVNETGDAPEWVDKPGITAHPSNPTTATGTTLNFGSIPSGVNRVIVVFDGISADGNDRALVRFGDSGGVETTGYSGIHFSNAFNSNSPTDGFILELSGASRTNTGQWEFTRMNGNKWVGTSVQTVVGDSAIATSASKTLSGELTQVEIVLTGSNSFDAGTVSVLYQ